MPIDVRKIDQLCADTIYFNPIGFDFSKGYGESWDIVIPDFADYSIEEMKEFLQEYGVSLDGRVDCLIDIDDDEYLESARNVCVDTIQENMDSIEPIVNCLYPLPSDFDPKGKRVLELPNCTLVVLKDQTYALALTCVGMDCSHEICLSYMLLGYLPPICFCDLRRSSSSGFPESASDRALVKACKESCRIALMRIGSISESLDRFAD
jgi:hypothetical protein